MDTLGINAAFHDSAACLVCDGRVVAAAEEEPFTRIKHSPGCLFSAVFRDSSCARWGKDLLLRGPESAAPCRRDREGC
jgi:carbamoyltransferase-like protein